MRDALVRLGQFEDPPVEPIAPAVEQLRYRNKVEYSFGASDAGELTLGFHHPGRWDLIDDLRDDVLASERVDEVREAVRRRGAPRRACRPSTARTTSGFLRNLVVREGRRTGQIQARLVTSPGAFRHDELAAARPGRERALDAGRGRGGDHARRQDQDAEGRRRRSRRSWRSAARGCASRSRPRPSSRPTRRWPSGCTPRRSSWPASPAGSGSSTSSAASARSHSPSRWTRARSWGWRWWSGLWPTRSRTRAATGSTTPASTPATCERRCARCWRRRARPSGRRRPAPRRPVPEGRAPRPGGRSQADRLRVVQPHHAGPQRPPDGRRGLRAQDSATGGHVPADTPHRDSGAAGEQHRSTEH